MSALEIKELFALVDAAAYPVDADDVKMELIHKNNLNGDSFMPITDEAVEAAAQALHVAEHGPWVSGGGITPGGTPWGTSRESERHATYFQRAEAALYAAAPFLVAKA